MCLFANSGVVFALFVFVLCHVYPMLLVSLDCPFIIAPSVLSNFYFHFDLIIHFRSFYKFYGLYGALNLIFKSNSLRLLIQWLTFYSHLKNTCMSVSIHSEWTFRRIPLVKSFHFLVKYLHQATKMSGCVYVCYDYLYLKPWSKLHQTWLGQSFIQDGGYH